MPKKKSKLKIGDLVYTNHYHGKIGGWNSEILRTRITQIYSIKDHSSPMVRISNGWNMYVYNLFASRRDIIEYQKKRQLFELECRNIRKPLEDIREFVNKEIIQEDLRADKASKELRKTYTLDKSEH